MSLERLDDRSIEAIYFGQLKSHERGLPFFGTGFLLLGISKVGSATLESLGITFEEVNTRIEKMYKPRTQTQEVELPFTAACKSVVQSAISLADCRNDQEVELDHLILAILSESDINEGSEGLVACKVLSSLQVDFDSLRKKALSSLEDSFL